MSKAMSCGFILFDPETGRILGCHPTGHQEGPEMSYDIPKGHLEEGETPLKTAKRELKEETGIVLPADTPIHEIGKVPYQSSKSLYLFSATLPGLEGMLGSLACTSKFEDSFGNMKKEIDSYTMTDYHEWFFKNMQPYIKAEQVRARLDTPACIIKGTSDVDGDTVKMKVFLDESKRKTARDFIVEINDHNLRPNGFGYQCELPDGTPVTVELEDVQAGLLKPVVVDVDGKISKLPDFDLDDWAIAVANQK